MPLWADAGRWSRIFGGEMVQVMAVVVFVWSLGSG